MWAWVAVLAIGLFGLGYWYGSRNGYSNAVSNVSDLLAGRYQSSRDGSRDPVYQHDFDADAAAGFLRDAPKRLALLFAGIALIGLALYALMALI